MTRYIEVPREYFVRYIRNRVHQNNKNFLSLCSGIPGEGKSYSMLRLAEECDPTFNADRIIFTAKELMQVINSNTLKRGSALVVDEFGTLHNSRAFQSSENRMVNFLIQTFRRMGFIMLGCAPTMGLIDKATRDLLHCHFITTGIDKREKVVRLKPLLLQPSQRDDKVYFKYLRVGGLVPRNKLVAVTELAMPLPSKLLRDSYEKRRDEFQAAINKDIEQRLDSTKKKPIGALAARTVKDSEKAPLSPKELKIYKSLLRGTSPQDISKRIEMSLPAVHQHIYRIRLKGWNC